MSKHNNEFPWVIFSIKNTLFAISACNVQSMVAMPPVVQVPYTPDYVRGVVNLRGRVIPVIDLRTRLGMKSFLLDVEEFCTMLEQRERDHHNWLQELEASVHERRDFKLTVDPHLCAFGKWFDSYKPESNLLEMLVKKFKTPHEKIHAIAAEVKSLEKSGDIDAAHEIIEQCRNNELSEMLGLFAEMRKAYIECSREICVVMLLGSRYVAVTVDSIESVEKLTDNGFEELPGAVLEQKNKKNFVFSTGRRSKHDDLVFLLDHTKIAGEIIKKAK